MKKIIVLILLIIGSISVKAQFPTTDSLRSFINRYIRNSAVEAFQNLRLNTALIGMTNYIDSAYGGQVVSFTAPNDSTARIITLGGDTMDIVIRGNPPSITLTNTGTGYSLVATPNGSIKRLSPGYGVLMDSTTAANSITIKADTTGSNPLVTTSDLNESVAAITTVQIDSLIYNHSGSEVDTLTKTALINKTILVVNAHPYTLFPTTSAPAADQVRVNSTTGGIKFGTPIQDGQQVTIIYKYTASVGTAAVNSVNGQTGNITIAGDETKVTAGSNVSIAGLGTTASPYVVSATGGAGGGATLSQVDSAVVRAVGKTKAVHMSGILRPTWDGSQTTWEVLGQADGHDTCFSPNLSVSVVGSAIRLNYPSMQFVAGMQANGDDVLARDAYTIGPSAGTSFTQFTIYKNFQISDLWSGSDLLDGSYSMASGSYYRVKCDTATGIFTVDLSLGMPLYNCDVVAGNYYDNAGQSHVVNYRRATTGEIQFYLVNTQTGAIRKGLLTTNDNFFIRINGRRTVSADGDNFGANAAIFFDGMFITY